MDWLEQEHLVGETAYGELEQAFDPKQKRFSSKNFCHKGCSNQTNHLELFRICIHIGVIPARQAVLEK